MPSKHTKHTKHARRYPMLFIAALIANNYETGGTFVLDKKYRWATEQDWIDYPEDKKPDGQPVFLQAPANRRGFYVYKKSTQTLEPVTGAQVIDILTIKVLEKNVIKPAPAFNYSTTLGGSNVFEITAPQSRTISLAPNRQPDAATINGQNVLGSNLQLASGTFGATRLDGGSFNSSLFYFIKNFQFSATENADIVLDANGQIIGYNDEATVERTETIVGVYPMLHGKAATQAAFRTRLGSLKTDSERSIQGKSNVTVTVTLNTSANEGRFFFSYPAAYGKLTGIFDVVNNPNLNLLVANESTPGFFNHTNSPANAQEITSYDENYNQEIYGLTEPVTGTFTFEMRF
jgi:hypothetical protein